MHRTTGLGYLYQKRGDGSERPIRFMSKSLSQVQCRWSTIEKECFAIVEALRELRYIIGQQDRLFTLQTDHRNLTFMTSPDKGKVVENKVERWKNELLQYNFVMEYIKGEENEVADKFSDDNQRGNL